MARNGPQLDEYVSIGRVIIKLPKVLSRHSMPAEFLPPDIREKVETTKGIVQLTHESEAMIVERLLRELKPLQGKTVPHSSNAQRRPATSGVCPAY
jgi:hypothetical protein